MNSGGVMGGGIVATVTGKPTTQLAMVMQNGAGTGMMSSAFASGVTINLNGSTTYQIDEDNMDMSGLPFTPLFDAGHIYVGQSVIPVSPNGMMSGAMGGMMGGSSMAGTITASGIALEPQGLSGTVASAITSGARNSVMLTLPSNSAFTTLTGSSTVTIYQQPGTTIAGASSIASGATVHAFGLLFFESGEWRMVASRISSI
jgi:hypothetical protein